MRNISTKQTRLAAIIIMIVLLAGCAAPAINTKDGKALECEFLGGEKIPQPRGSSITACCYDNGCWICDEKGDDCVFEPAYFSPAWKDAPFFKAYQR